MSTKNTKINSRKNLTSGSILKKWPSKYLKKKDFGFFVFVGSVFEMQKESTKNSRLNNSRKISKMIKNIEHYNY